MKIVITIETDGEGKVNVTTETDERDKAGKDEPCDFSQYARFFDDGRVGWTKDPEYNLMFLKQQECFANDKLRAQGYLLLNDVYDMLGIPRSKVGMVVGWIYDKENHIGDNRVDFGLYSKQNQEFINGYRAVAILDFNVDGDISGRLPD